MSIEKRRSDVFHLLKECWDEKLLRGGTADSIFKASQAYEIAWQEPLLPEPWPALAAYRLAHLKMRSADLAVEELHAIDRLFSQVRCPDALGPLPLIYHLAVLSRLRNAHPESCDKVDINNRLNETYDRAIKQMRQGTFLSQRSSESRQPLQNRQNSEFNLIELAGYFLGMPYDCLEGIPSSDRLGDPFQTRGWYVIGRGIERIDMTEELARCEFNGRAASADGLVLIQLLCDSAEWRMSSCGEWQNVNQDFAKLLILQQGEPIPMMKLKRLVVGNDGEDPDARFRQVKRRTREALRELTGRKDLRVFDQDAFADEVPILGLVEKRALRR